MKFPKLVPNGVYESRPLLGRVIEKALLLARLLLLLKTVSRSALWALGWCGQPSVNKRNFNDFAADRAGMNYRL